MRKGVALFLAVCALSEALTGCGREEKSETAWQPQAQEYADSAAAQGEEVPEDMEELFSDDEQELAKSGQSVPAYAKAYAEFLTGMQDGTTMQMPYGTGEGRFALAYITGDDIPELLVINLYDEAVIYTYRDGQVTEVTFEAGWTDVVRYDYRKIRYVERGNRFLLKYQTEDYYSDGWDVYAPLEDGTGFALAFRAYIRDGKYYCNVYDLQKMNEDSVGYMMEYEEQEATSDEYEDSFAAYQLEEARYQTVHENSIYRITPEDIRQVFGYPDSDDVLGEEEGMTEE